MGNNSMIDIRVLTDKIRNNENFIFVKRGDGELACMNGEVGHNCDGHPYSKELGDALKEAYCKLQDRAYIVEFDDQVNYNALLHRTDSDLAAVSQFYKEILKSRRPKVFIGPERLALIATMLGAWHITVHEVDAWAHYAEIRSQIPTLENGIYLYCAGMPAKVLIADMSDNINTTHLDCGSAFDPAIYPTRTYQITPTEFWKLYE